MFVQDLKRDFFNQLIGKRVLVIANFDIDSICASKILQKLFINERIIFTFVPVLGVKGLKRTFDSYKIDCNIFLFINCGGCLDLVELLSPEDNILLFVCDSHRPLDLCNIYSDSQVSLSIFLTFELKATFYCRCVYWEIQKMKKTSRSLIKFFKIPRLKRATKT